MDTRPQPPIETVRKKMALKFLQYLREEPEAFYTIGAGPPKSKTEWRHQKESLPDTEFYACEPITELFQQLLTVYPGQVLNVGISQEPTLKLYPEDSKIGINGRSSRHQIKSETALEPIEVPCMTLKEFDEHWGSPKSLVLWMDIEGSELDALQSGRQLLLSRRAKVVNLEVRDSHPAIPEWVTASQIEEFMKKHGYTRMLDYNNHKTHRDVIYIPEEESRYFPK